ncbi:hypothetical protein [Streptomyces tsukubensis]|uniref:hypothetical protein n=1 Tax=Streptomyces tsukubensis TaxID=83656 RepID=UPI00344DDC0B
MNAGDELLRGRVYGHGHRHPGPLPHRTYAVLDCGPLDGLPPASPADGRRRQGLGCWTVGWAL